MTTLTRPIRRLLGRSGPEATASPAPAKAPVKKHTVPPETRNHKTDKVNYQITGNDTRDACVRLMYDGLAFMSEDSKFLTSVSPFRPLFVSAFANPWPKCPTTSSKSPPTSRQPPTTKRASPTPSTAARCGRSSRT